MINNPLVLVLGAGASKPYGFPLGSELRLELCDLEKDASLLRKALVKHANLDDSQIREFAKSFRLSSIKSIDAFLAKRSEFAAIGKLAIAGYLLSKNHQSISEHDLEDDWYLELWNALQSGVSNITELKNNNLRIITFNYDYSIETSLHRSIVNTFGVSNEDAFSALRHIPILHVYGCIRNIDSVNVLTNQMYFDEQSLKHAAESIKIIPESRESDVDFETARKWFDWSDNTCFLGFGFDELNIKRLDFDSVISFNNQNEITNPQVTASTFGMTNAETELARARLGLGNADNDNRRRMSGLNPIWSALPIKSLMTIRNHIEILT